jgi:hypothetical protein
MKIHKLCILILLPLGLMACNKSNESTTATSNSQNVPIVAQNVNGVTASTQSSPVPSGTNNSGASPDLISQDISIVSPPQGTVVTPGQILKVVVQAPDGKFPLGVSIVSKDVLAPTKSTPPYEFDIRIPSDVLGQRQLTAIGMIAPGQALFSQPISVDVEGSASATAGAQITVEPRMILFQAVGQQIPLIVSIRMPNGVPMHPEGSSQVSYHADNPSVAVVDGNGLVTAAGGGRTQVSVTYGNDTKQIPVTVPQTVKGDLNGDGKIDNDDLAILESALTANAQYGGLWSEKLAQNPNMTAYDFIQYLPASISMPAKKPADAMDINGDGVINAQDARDLATLCNHPNCATR